MESRSYKGGLACIYIYIYIYTYVNPCITCTKQSGTEKKMMPIIDDHEPAFFERPFRTQAMNASGTFRACCGARAGSSGSGRAFCTSVVARRAPVEHFAVPEQIRTAPVEHSAALGQARAAITSQLRRWVNLERPFRASCGSGPISRGHFEPAAASGQARAAISSQLQLRARLDRPFRANCGSGPGSKSETSAGAVFSKQGRPRNHESPKSACKIRSPRTPKQTLRINICSPPPLSTLGSTFVNFIRFYKCSNFWKLIENLHDNLQKHFPFIFNKDSRNKCQGIGPGRSRNSFHGFFKRVSKNNVRGFQGAPKVFSNSFSSAFSWFIKV